MDRNWVRPFCFTITNDGYVYCGTHDHCSGMFFAEELYRMKSAIEKTLEFYERECITDSYIETEDEKAMKEEFSRFNRSRTSEKHTHIVDDLYLIIDKDSGLLKIGRSKDAKKRLQQLQTANGHKLELLCVVKNKGGLEERVQEKFSPINTNGEWYEYSQEIINEFVSLGGIFLGDTIEKKSKRFVKPTVEEIQAYIQEKGYTFDAEAFFAFYESNGWKVGRNPMKNWRMACTTWSKNRNNNNNTNNYGRETITEKIRRTVENANAFSQRIKERIGQPSELDFGDNESVW